MADLVLTWEAATFLDAAQDGFGIGQQIGRSQVHRFLQILAAEVRASGCSQTFVDGAGDAANAVVRQHGASLDTDPQKPTRVDVDTSFDREQVLGVYEAVVQAGVRPGVVEAVQDVSREVDAAREAYDTEFEEWEAAEAEAPGPDDEEFEDYVPEERPDPGYRDGHVHVLQRVQAHFGVSDEELE